MKITVAALGMLAAVASAAAPHRIFFPRDNHTYPVPTRSKAAPVPLTTSHVGHGYPKPPYQAPPSQPRPSEDAEVDSTTTITKSSIIHLTRTRYVHASTTPKPVTTPKPAPHDKPVEESHPDQDIKPIQQVKAGQPGGNKEEMTTTTITSHVTTTIVVSKHVGPTPVGHGDGGSGHGDGGNGHGGGGNGHGGGGAAGNVDCAPVTVTVTASPVASTVYVTVAPQPVAPRPDQGGQQPPYNTRPTVTSQSTITVVPYPSGNATQPTGYPRPSGFARLRR